MVCILNNDQVSLKAFTKVCLWGSASFTSNWKASSEIRKTLSVKRKDVSKMWKASYTWFVRTHVSEKLLEFCL